MVERFVKIALAQSHAIDLEKIGKYNRLFDRMTEVMGEFLVRPIEQRRALMKLYAHPDPQVRYMAAFATKDLDRDAARRVFEILIERNEYPQAADARGIIRRWDGESLI